MYKNNIEAMISYLHNNEIIRKTRSVLGSKADTSLPILKYIIDFLGSYKFFSDINDSTINQNELIDASVLGLIFEKLNGYKDGANFTPSVITEYIAKEAIEQSVVDAINTGMNWTCTSLSDIKDKIETRDERKKINSIINSLKICDPSVGSGHFLVSALNRIIAIKKQLGVLFKFNSDERVKEYDIKVVDDILTVTDGNGNSFAYSKNDNESREIQETLFNEKRTIIENCLFGVDINSKAVYICQLRLWIELLKNAYYRNGVMETLPNIDINIKKGNSLLSKVDYVTGKKIKTDAETKRIIAQYKDLVAKYKAVSDKSVKKELKQQLLETKGRIHGLYEQLSWFETIDITYNHAFEWGFEFPEILDDNGKFIGFDVIIGNPPYIQLQSMGIEADKLQNMRYKTYARTGDIYCLFYELAYKLLKPNGFLAFITSNKWMRTGYGEALRDFLSTNTNPLQLIDFAGEKVFDSATVDVNILMFRKNKNKNSTLSCIIKDSSWRNNMSEYIKQNAQVNSYNNSASWIILSPIEQSIKAKIEAVGTPLRDWNISINYGIKTGFNDAFIISGTKKDELIAADPKSAEIIRPILRGRDIKRYGYDFADLWIINTHNGIKERGIPPINVNEYPAIKVHLDQYFEKLVKRTDKGDTPYNLRNCVYTDDFSKQKIVWGNLCLKAQYSFAEEGYYINAPSTMIVGGNEYILAVLNSKVADWYIRQLGVKRSGGYFEYKPMFVENIPIPHIPEKMQEEFKQIVFLISQKSKMHADTAVEEEQIDDKVFSLFGLSEKERKVILGKQEINASL